MSYRKLSFIFGIIISIISFSLAFLRINNWHYGGVVGVWLIFDYLNFENKGNTTFSLLLDKRWEDFFKVYFLLSLVGILIELIGHYWLGFWYYPRVSFLIEIISIPIFYPFILMSFKEMYEFLKVKVKFPFVFSMLLGIIIWEIPNMISKDWIYTLPIEYKIFNLNVIIILGWSILILLPILVYRYLRI